MMTPAQIKRLHTICAKVEALQKDCASRRDADDLGAAKNRLLDVLRRNET